MSDKGLFSPGDPGAALALLTRLPAPGADHARGARAAWAWPLAGLAVGVLAGLAAEIGGWLGLPPAVVAGVALTAMALATGGLHQDGLSDTADGLWGGHDRARRLEIMRDSRVGSYGVLALVLVLGMQWAALSALAAEGAIWPALIVAAMASRASMAGVMAALPHAREDGLSRLTGRPSTATAGAAAVLAFIAALGLTPGGAILLAVLLPLAAALVATAAKAKIGGQTGDVLGATQQVTELLALATLAALV
ncbi:adenosylcobinamide-GDP ribazoletransferase [Histidinibacterium aquaticum]|uniref:Adenosylcobinamide-GDP ribazoletransferase n=1 Tax=Histidinibacterium aquaticum TaxID=2613962 RepID=A0A5J5GN86_9RHOB|nr:adenosylcobinamide-GDP ribazoletransferase [Histidinibacterium aquaticum]KAA9009811.1 adenosylcobinamide-GDP ribazoletransferase [Histidinibacterium aquaticum]